MNKDNRVKLRDGALIAMTAAVICLCSWLTIPFTVPFTMQTFAVIAALLLLGGKRGLLAIGLYLLLGLVGLPVFSGFRGGPGHLLGPTGGYLVGFLFTGLAYLLMEKPLIGRGKLIHTLACTLALIPCYLVGTLWFTAVYSLQGKEMGFFTALGICVLPYILPDIVKTFLAVTVSLRVRKYLPK